MVSMGVGERAGGGLDEAEGVGEVYGDEVQERSHGCWLCPQLEFPDAVSRLGQ